MSGHIRTPAYLFPRETAPCVARVAAGWVANRSGRFEEEKDLFFLSEIKIYFPVR